MADPFHGVHYSLAFQSQLGRIGQVLQLTASALGIYRAGRGYPVRGRDQQLGQPGLAVIFLQDRDLGLDPFTGQRTRHKKRKTAEFAHSFSGASQSGDGQFDIFFGFEGYVLFFHNISIIPRFSGKNPTGKDELRGKCRKG